MAVSMRRGITAVNPAYGGDTAGAGARRDAASVNPRVRGRYAVSDHDKLNVGGEPPRTGEILRLREFARSR